LPDGSAVSARSAQGRAHIAVAGGPGRYDATDNISRQSRRPVASLKCLALRRSVRDGRAPLSGRWRCCPRPQASIWQALPSDFAAAVSRANAAPKFTEAASRAHLCRAAVGSWLWATGKPPARTADRRSPGPFARFVERCLLLVGARRVSAVKLINRLRSRDAGG
jgi:hypothetical protein